MDTPSNYGNAAMDSAGPPEKRPGSDDANRRFDVDRAESRADSNQRLIMYGAVVGSVALALQHIVVEAHLHGWPIIAVTLTSLVGWAVFAIGIFRNKRLDKTPGGREFFRQVRTDERLIAIQSQAFSFGFWSMLAVQVILLLLWVFFGHLDTGLLSIPVAASSTIAAGTTGAVIRYQILINR